MPEGIVAGECSTGRQYIRKVLVIETCTGRHVIGKMAAVIHHNRICANRFRSPAAGPNGRYDASRGLEAVAGMMGKMEPYHFLQIVADFHRDHDNALVLFCARLLREPPLHLQAEEIHDLLPRS
jgi:hypothetical protein